METRKKALATYVGEDKKDDVNKMKNKTKIL